MIHHKCTCDGCDKDLTHVESGREYRLALRCETLPFAGNMAWDIYPPFNDTAHFCSRKCLVGWVEKNVRETD